MAERVLESLSNRLLQLDSLIEVRPVQNATEQQTREFVEKMKNPSTVAKTKSDMKKFTDFLHQENETRSVETFPPCELDMYLARFFLSVRKPNNSEFEPDTIKSYQSSLHRYLSDKNYQESILTGPSFKHSRDVLTSKRKALKQLRLGNKKNRAEPFTEEEISILHQKNLLGPGKILEFCFHFSIFAKASLVFSRVSDERNV